MDPVTLTNVLLVIATVAVPITGYVLKTLHDKINDHREDCERRSALMAAELRAAQSKEDAIRSEARIDRDISNLRIDVSKGFDRLYETLSENKKELLAAIQSLRGK